MFILQQYNKPQSQTNEKKNLFMLNKPRNNMFMEKYSVSDYYSLRV